MSANQEIGFVRLAPFCFVFLCGLASFQAAQADTHYVSHSGSDTYPYTSWTTATDSVDLAFAAAESGDTILVGIGVFHAGELTLKSGMALVGAGKDSTHVIHSGSGLVFISLEDSTLIDGLHLSGVTDTTEHGTIFYTLDEGVRAVHVKSAIVRNSRITDMWTAIYVGAAAASSNEPVAVENNDFSELGFAIYCYLAPCVFRNNRFVLHYQSNDGMLIEGCSTAVFENNVFRRENPGRWHTTSFEGVQHLELRNNIYWAPSFAGGTHLGVNLSNSGEVTTGVVENNLFVGAEIAIASSGGNFRIRNNIITRTLAGSLVYDTAQTDAEAVGFNLFYLNQEVFMTPDTTARLASGCLFADPMFVDSMDFHLQAYSPAIDAGDTLLLDADGSRSDIGPYGGPGGLVYAYQDRSPDVPKGLSYTIDALANPPELKLVWFANGESDLGGYEVQVRKEVPVVMFDSTFEINVSSPETTLTFTDTLLFWEIAIFTFDVRSYDQQGNKSEWTGDPIFISAGGSSDDPGPPLGFALRPNHPNPFNAQTRLRYALPEAAHVTLTILDVLGRNVITLVNGMETSGEHEVLWDGRNQDGRSVASGVYFYRLSTEGFKQSRSMLLLK